MSTRRPALAVGALLALLLSLGGPRTASASLGDSCGIGDVTTYGATGGDTTDDTAAIQSAAASAGQNPLCFPAGTYYFSSTLTHTPGYVGAGRESTTLRYTGGGVALSSPSPSVRTYNTRISGLRVVDGGTGTIGLDMPCVSVARVDNVQVADFDTGLKISCGTDGGALYNAFTDLTVSGATTGIYITGLSSNENKFWACRTNVTTNGVVIDGGNRNVFQSCAFESGTNGVDIVNNDSDRNQVISSRFENLTGFSARVQSGVRGTVLAWNDRVASTAGAYVTTGTDTTILDNQPGGAALNLTDTATSGDPVTMQLDVTRWSGVPLQVERSDGVELLRLNGDGALKVRTVTSLPSYARAGVGALLVYDSPTAPPRLIICTGSGWVYVDGGGAV